MKPAELNVREDMARLCKSLFNRGFSVGTAGNVSVRLEDGILMTPTNVTLGDLVPERIAKIDLEGNHVAGDRPTKEVFLHQAFYETRPQAGAVVHLHSTWATALSCLTDVNADDCIPPLTPYVVMRVGAVKLVPYVKPGDPKSGELIRDLNGQYGAVLLGNHGPVVSGKDLFSAVCAAEELEETAKLLVALRGQKTKLLSEEEVAELQTTFGTI
ncbi:Ribulose-5-phosphate 4-epimerase/Fuculose-1-phosphate aldolase [Epibacterium ulvae]|uniref:3-oxo-tetronate 4-phosphate decarboxylase n=1 Tax=Epibacterium ulvae TaxID=1156985 RepID=A0A1G5QZD1_9RHOB|nr:3-oxo-tetronate 4-phosphate decarboxylase [Epibacterium ulvae]SCZ67205.1 Ribulose-5-phosphate 4-epimerase/Fuculose-1-phosphate aldolase [Epibacterium ulvae]